MTLQERQLRKGVKLQSHHDRIKFAKVLDEFPDGTYLIEEHDEDLTHEYYAHFDEIDSTFFVG